MPSIFTTLARFSPFRMSSPSSGITAAAAAVAASAPAGSQKATVAAGCFWGVEHEYRKHFEGKGLYDARVGYIGGDSTSPSYRGVCSGSTGHAEATQITFDPKQLSYAQILEFFYKMHDPTTINQQGGDRGTQYRSGIFYHDAEQEKVAREVTAKANAQWWKGKVITEILPAKQWWDAEDYHQLYLVRNPDGYVCASHHVRQFPDLQ
ncbi:peptide methionine sulfoxide reductase [Ophiostoma piceae UAMH 11346]|uniref:peptide-methionine (S)-S-oxide reductase n=1 Tax=Ophiostoma piceae (strain UAMH 11346) TaxID=1262450 RepID=S3CAB2_OPHP1|nr:peptide methionine sulfoxide reductase [Ophiostoma piceae UAMH 11346]